MAIESYYSLIDDICERSSIPNPVSLYAAAGLEVKGVNFSLFHGGAIAPESALLYSDFGDVPTHARAAVLLHLLGLNLYLFSANPPAFCYNGETQRLVLVCRLPLAGTTAEKALALMSHTADMALEWRGVCGLAEKELAARLQSSESPLALKVRVLLELLAGMMPAQERGHAEVRPPRAASSEKNARLLRQAHAAGATSAARNL